MFGNGSNKSKLIHKEPSLFLSAVQNLQGYNFACGSVWVQILVSDIREEHKLIVFENRVLRIFGLKRNEVMRSFLTCTLCQA
jgi:hypothetical protein